MIKAFLTLIFISLLSPATAQDHATSLARNYVSTNILDDTCFFLIQPSLYAPAEIFKSIKRNALRILTGDVYIVEKSFLKNVDPLFITTTAPANDLWKLSASAKSLMISHQHKIYNFILQLRDGVYLQYFISKYNLADAGIKAFNTGKIIYLPATVEDISLKYLSDPHVTYIDVSTTAPREELGVNGFDLTANQINLVHSLFPDMNGEGQHVSIKEQNIDTTDIDLRGRIDPAPLAAPLSTNHANIMATIIAGAGNSVWYAKGVAPAAHISSSDFTTLLPDDNKDYLLANITVQNHSYGTLIDNEYGLNAVAFDRSANMNTNLLHVFSSGNSGLDTSASGFYKGIGGYASLTGNFKMAKNIMVVGGVDSFGNIAPQSSNGPAYDGRIKPDIVAFQINGTSESAALVSGTANLLQQFYKSKHADSLLPSALARAILINSATDVGNTGPDYKSGFGNLNAYKAMATLKNNFIYSGMVTENQLISFPLTLPANASRLKVSLCWNDPAATPAAPIALMNDLDLSVISLSGTYLPWVLSVAADEDSLNNNAVRGRDSLNNEEQVTVENPGGGTFTIRVNGFKLITDSQQFYIAYEYDTTGFFQWQSPVRSDFINAGEVNMLRWQSNISSIAAFEYSYAPYTQWLPITLNANLKSTHFLWHTPATPGHVILRMKTVGAYFYSDTLLISQLANPKVGFICADSLLVYWNIIPRAESYLVYVLGAQYMEPIKNISDTSIILTKAQVASKFIAVAPVIAKDTGTKSYAFNYDLQATGCYINSFFAVINGRSVMLSLSVGTSYLIDSISFEILVGNRFETIYLADQISQFSYQFNYAGLKEGVTYFRARIKLLNGATLYSTLQSVIYIPPGNYILAPNPLRKNQILNIYSGDSGEANFSLYDGTGRFIFLKQISSAHESVDIHRFPSGIYYFIINKTNVKKASGKLIIID